MISSGFDVKVIENRTDGDELRTDISGIEEAVSHYGKDRIFGVVTTTSCFAPRGCDAVEEVGKLCEKYGIVHVVNNAYGLQVGRGFLFKFFFSVVFLSFSSPPLPPVHKMHIRD